MNDEKPPIPLRMPVVKIGEVIWSLGWDPMSSEMKRWTVVATHADEFEAKAEKSKGRCSFQNVDEDIWWTRKEQEARKIQSRVLQDDLQRRILTLESDIKAAPVLLRIEHSRHADRIQQLVKRENELHNKLDEARLKLADAIAQNALISDLETNQ